MCGPDGATVKGYGEDICQGPCHDERNGSFSDDIEEVALAGHENATVKEDDADLDEAIRGRHEQLRNELHFLHQRDLRVSPCEDEVGIGVGRPGASYILRLRARRLLFEQTESWDESASALLKTASEGPTTVLNKALLEKINTICPFASATAILDTGCGVAQVLGSLLGTYGVSLPVETRLVAADLSPGMISVVDARREAEVSAGNSIWNRVETAIWDAQNLAAVGVPDETFSHITAGLVLFMVERPQDVLLETHRVLCDGGLFGMTSFRSVQWMDLVGEALNAIKPGSDLPPIPAAWASTQSIARQLEDAGFRDVTAEEVKTYYEFEDPEPMTRFNVANIPSVKMVTAEFSADEVEKAIQWMLQWLAERFSSGKGKLEGIAIVATARK
ncbi:hypothetical protein NPX13_g7175 [Xylaria arbuscula]|uniref:Methyltransferase type 11 domain-containing protein n=1 Tax=Xylaria arbuscula TaxID=114810 RepID=A0A9W8TL14_9PEZI|nr:hypothetical protein NPX13_g7175 [Xylaria arbuscula]